MAGLDIRIVIAIAAFCILMIALGGVTREDSSDKSERNLEEKNTLIESIEEHNAEDKGTVRLWNKEQAIGSGTSATFRSSYGGDYPQGNAPAPADTLPKITVEPPQPQGYYPPPPLPPDGTTAP